MLRGKSEILTSFIDKFCAGLAMRLLSTGYFGNAFSNQRVSDNELRSAILAIFRHFNRIEELLHVLPIDFLDIEAVPPETCSCVLALRCPCHRIERHRVAVVNENEVIETEMSGERTRFG